jgi:hypothetical protein
MPLAGLIDMSDEDKSGIVKSPLSQNTYVMMWIIASVASLFIFVKFF